MDNCRALLALAIAATHAGCAPPCAPPTVAPAPVARADYRECSSDSGTSAVLVYAAAATDSVRHPDRIIAGPHTGLCGPSAVARGPSGELYVLNHAPMSSPGASSENRWMHWVTVYDSAARGDASPSRMLHVAARGMPLSLAVDSGGYLYVGSGADPRMDSGSVTVFESGADGDAEPLRVLFGPGNGLRRPGVLAVDRRGFLYVGNAQDRREDNAVRVFGPRSDGEVAACRVIAGPRTGLKRPGGLALDRESRLYVGNSGVSPSALSSITVYAAGAAGDATPIRTLSGGPKYDESSAPERLGFDSHDSLYVKTQATVSVFAPGATGASEPARYIMRIVPGHQFATVHTPQLFALDPHDTLYAMSGDTVMVYAPGYSGTEPAVRRIAGPRSGVRGVTGLALDNRGWLYLAERGSHMDSSLIRVYAPGADGDVPPTRTIMGPRTRLRFPAGMALDRKRRLYVANGPNSVSGGSILAYAPGARGEDQPVRILAGRETRLAEPVAMTFDTRGDLYVSRGYAPGVVDVFRSEASGDEAPVRSILGPIGLVRRTVALAFGPGDTLYALNVHGYRGRCDPLARANATVTAYAPGAGGEIAPVRTLVLTQDGKSPGCNDGLGFVRGLAVDTTGAVQVWHHGGAVLYPPGAEGLTAPLRSIAETASPGSDPSGVAVPSGGWVYQTSAPGLGTCN